MDTGFPSEDAQTDFRRARRRSSLAKLGRWVTGQAGDVNVILPFDEVVEALGRTGERELGLQTIPLDSIVGTVDRVRDFDRRFRPSSGHVRSRWERMAEAMRRGKSFPPIKVYRVGGLHFVRDGHHRVSVARAQGHEVIEAYVTEVHTRVEPGQQLQLAELPHKSHQRVFLERVPLPAEARERIVLSDADDYARLAEGVEAWGFRIMQERGELLGRRAVARAWYEQEYVPVVEMLREAELLEGPEAAGYMAVAEQRYRLMRTHSWDDDVLERLAEARS